MTSLDDFCFVNEGIFFKQTEFLCMSILLSYDMRFLLNFVRDFFSLLSHFHTYAKKKCVLVIFNQRELFISKYIVCCYFRFVRR